MWRVVFHLDTLFILFFLWTTGGPLVKANLYDTIRNNANTTKFADWIDDSEMKELFVSTACNAFNGCPTVFVPTNLAVDASTKTLNWQSLTLAKKKYLISGHIYEGRSKLTTFEWTQSGSPMNLRDVGFGTGRKIVFQMNNIRYAFETNVDATAQRFVSQARLIPPEIHATNGLIHVIDSVLNTPSSVTPFLNYVMEQEDLKISAELWFQIQNDPRYLPFLIGQEEQYATFFVATDEAWSKVPGAQLQVLKSNTTLLAEVLSYGYLPNQLVYSEWTAVKSKIQLQSGFPIKATSHDPVRLRSAVLLRASDGLTYITGNGQTAQLTGLGEDIKKAVVYKTNTVLGYVWETFEQVIRRLNMNFLQECRSDKACNNLLTTESQLTFFVPIESGMARFRSLSPELKTIYLKYMVLPGRITGEQMNSRLLIEINNLPAAIRFHIQREDVFVEARLPQAGYVATRILKINQMATNGVAHSIDGIPGLPVQTIEQYLSRIPEYSKYSAYRFVQENLVGGPYVYLVPTNEALEAMQRDANVGALLLDNVERRSYIFRRHSLPITTLFEDLSLGLYKAPTENYAFTGEELDLNIKVNNGQERVTTIKFEDQSTDVNSIEGAYQFTNGLVYRLNKLLYIEKDLTSDLCTNPACP